MRLFDAVLLVGLLGACGQGGYVPPTGPIGSITTTTGYGTTTTTGCKPLASTWQSTSDLERHDWTNVSKAYNVYTDYQYTGYNGILCPGANQPMRANLVQSTHPASGEFQYQLQIHHNHPQPGCNGWEIWPTTYGTPYNTRSSVSVRLGCNVVTICNRTYPAPDGCKEFR